MNTVQYGEWKIAVDMKKTREYYQQYRVKNTQANRNFATYCKTLSYEEQAFFDDLGINPTCCNIEHIGVDRKGNFPCGGHYFVCGEYLAAPTEKVVPLEDFVEMDPDEIDEEDDRVNIGIFQFDFQREENLFKEIPDDMPEGFLCINFWCEEMKWLLIEEPEEKMYEPPKFWEIHKKIKECLANRKLQKAMEDEAKAAFLHLFEELHIDAEPLDKRELKKYKNDWITGFIPKDANEKAIRKECFPRGYTAYPWHLFSFEVLPHESEETANKRFDQQTKPHCVLVSNIDNFAFHLRHADDLTSQHLSQFDDITITASDFAWTYSKTHEEYCGPYFYSK